MFVVDGPVLGEGSELDTRETEELSETGDRATLIGERRGGDLGIISYGNIGGGASEY